MKYLILILMISFSINATLSEEQKENVKFILSQNDMASYDELLTAAAISYKESSFGTNAKPRAEFRKGKLFDYSYGWFQFRSKIVYSMAKSKELRHVKELQNRNGWSVLKEYFLPNNPNRKHKRMQLQFTLALMEQNKKICNVKNIHKQANKSTCYIARHNAGNDINSKRAKRYAKSVVSMKNRLKKMYPQKTFAKVKKSKKNKKVQVAVIENSKERRVVNISDHSKEYVLLNGTISRPLDENTELHWCDTHYDWPEARGVCWE